MQIVVKILFRQREFGMIAGLSSCSCLLTQKIKAGMRAMAVARRAMFAGTLIRWVAYVMELAILSTFTKMEIKELTQTHKIVKPWKLKRSELQSNQYRSKLDPM